MIVLFVCSHSEVDEPWIKDDFNLCGLDEQIDHYKKRLATVLSKRFFNADEKLDDATACLYGMIHARFILTALYALPIARLLTS